MQTASPTFKKRDFDFAKHGAFFAFGNKQFDEAKKPGVKYVSLGSGLLMRKDNHLEVLKLFSEHNRNEIKREKAARSKNSIILSELSNYECFYIGDITDAVDALASYGYTTEEIQEVYNANKDNCDDF